MPGILNARAAREKFQFTSLEPAVPLTRLVAHYWCVTWDLRGQDPYKQQVLPYPSVNMTFKTGRCRVAGVLRGRFFEELSGTGRVFAVRFKPGGFRPFLGAPVFTLTDRFAAVDAIFGADGAQLAEAILAADVPEAVTLMDHFLTGRLSAADPMAELAVAIVERIAADPALTRVDQLAAEYRMTTRTLQRLFADYVGVGPKWVIRRYRLHEAAARAADGSGVDCVRLASDLGYSDQAHFTRDFTATIGVSPARYARAQG